MKLVDRYVYDVVRRLPEKQRNDVSKELTTEIQEMIEDRANGEHAGKKVTHDILIELGSPSQLADRYRERQRYIIGPDYYEPYIFLLKTIYAVVLPLLAFLLFMSEAMTVNHSVLSLFVKITGVLFEVSVHIFFWTTLSFIFVQKLAAGQRHDHDWKPDDLPDLPPEQEITRGESFFAIAWSVLAVFATLYQVPSIYQLIGPSEVPQFFAPDMWPGWTIGLLVVALLGLAVEWIKLAVGGWTKLTVGLVTAANAVTIGFFVAVVSTVRPIANPAMMELITETVGKENIAQTVEVGIKVFVAIVVVVCLWEIGEAVYRYRKGAK